MSFSRLSAFASALGLALIFTGPAAAWNDGPGWRHRSPPAYSYDHDSRAYHRHRHWRHHWRHQHRPWWAGRRW